jgi:hypothetical protein
VKTSQLKQSSCQLASSPNQNTSNNLLSTENYEPETKKPIIDNQSLSTEVVDNCSLKTKKLMTDVEQLTGKAIANSSELVTLDEQIALIDKRLVVAGERIEHTSKKRWTNYLSTDPLRIAANVFGGGDVQRDNIAIADLEVKSAELEAYL